MSEPTGDICAECDGPLSRKGFCKNPRCPYYGLWQDEFPTPEVVREKRRVVGNIKSKRAYRYGTAGYRRNLGSAHAVVFPDDIDAERAGFEVRDE